MKPDKHGKHPTAEEYRSWGSNRAVVITYIVVALTAGGIITWLILTGHHPPGSPMRMPLGPGY